MKIFNSDFEMELRILLLLSQTKRALSKEEIVNYDFITIYSADFGIGEENLHGDNRYKYGEFASRQELCWIRWVLTIPKLWKVHIPLSTGKLHVKFSNSIQTILRRRCAQKSIKKQ